MGIAIGLGMGPDIAVCSALYSTTTTATATLVGDTPGTVGYGGSWTVGRLNAAVVGVDAVLAAIIRAVGVDSDASLLVSVVLPLSISTVSVCASVCAWLVSVSAAGALVAGVGVVAGLCASSVVGGASAVGVVGGVELVVPEPVWGCSVGVVLVGSVVGGVDVVPVGGEPAPETVVPEPPEALTDVVGPSPEVVVVVVVVDCEPGGVAVVVGSVDAVVPDVPEAPEVVVPEPVVVVAFDPVSGSVEPDCGLSPVLADATPGLVATATPRPTAKAKWLARLARVGRFACFPCFADAMTCSRLPRVAVSWDPVAGA